MDYLVVRRSKLIVMLSLLCSVVLAKDVDYEVIPERIDSIPGDYETIADSSNFSIVRHEGEYVFSGNITFTMDLYNNFTISTSSAYIPHGSSQLIKHPIKLPATRICDFLRGNYKKYIKELLAGETNLPDVPPEGLCPFPKGVYYIINASLNDQVLPTHLPEGLWKLKHVIKLGDACVGGFMTNSRIYRKISNISH